MKSSTLILLFAAALVSAGCGGPALDCNSSEAKETTLKIFGERLEKMPWYREMSASLSAPKLVEIRTEQKDEKAGRAVCAATYAFDYNDKPRSVPVRYIVEKFEDSKGVRVSTDPRDVIATLMTTAMFEKPIRKGGQAAKAAEPTQPAVAPQTANAPAMSESQLMACVDRKLAAFRKEAGSDALATAPQLEEWEGQCKAGK